MFTIRKSFLSIGFASFLFSSSMIYAATATNSEPAYVTNKSFFYIDWLYIKPTSDNLKYATFVAGAQPFYQNWHYQAINPDYHSTFDLGFNYALPCSFYSAAVDWTHLNSTDSSSKQASNNTDLNTVEFVAPPFEMSPPVFGIKRVDAKVNFNFDNILLNFTKLIAFNPNVQMRLFGGIDVLTLKQTMTTTFSDQAGSPGTPYSYALPPDPLFSFALKNYSNYTGAGPDVGLNVQYETDSHFGILGQFLGSVTAGTIKTKDGFTSTSTRLTALGIGTSHQEISAPNATQIVFGVDGKLGVFYHYIATHFADLTIQAGYRMATYINAISTVNPNTLVQPGTVVFTPEFSTGTMAIVSTDARSRPFSFNGPFLDVQIAMD